MNIQYKENTDGKRFVEIQFRPRKADDADKFLSLIEEGGCIHKHCHVCRAYNCSVKVE
ncbi:MAG: hypothetical protein K6B68_00150 [Eubacterium sp.]|nr:hypothetical protein [Eubacterium sp.]